MVGDDEQLPPIIFSTENQGLGYSSMFNSLIRANDDQVIVLKT